MRAILVQRLEPPKTPAFALSPDFIDLEARTTITVPFAFDGGGVEPLRNAQTVMVVCPG